MIEIVYDIPPYLFLPIIVLLIFLIAIIIHILAERRKKQYLKKLRSLEVEEFPMLKTWHRLGTVNGVRHGNLKRMPQSLNSPASSGASFPTIKQSIPFSYLHFASPATQAHSIQYGHREALV